MSRIAYIGLSSPVFYDYKHPANKTINDCSTSPNPILDSATGLMLMFDEIWFLCESLCPKNMRHLPFVKFLDQDENKLIPSMKNFENIKKVSSEHMKDVNTSNEYRNISSHYGEIVDALKINWNMVDNHTHGLKIQDSTFSANSWNLDNILIDIEIMKVLQFYGAELITNSFTETWLTSYKKSTLEAQLIQKLIVNGVPSITQPEGPFHESIIEARDNIFWKDFRSWANIKSENINKNEINEICMQANSEITQYRNNVFLKHLDPKNIYISSTKALIGFGADLVPGLNTIIGAGEELINLKNELKIRDLRWQGFLVTIGKA